MLKELRQSAIHHVCYTFYLTKLETNRLTLHSADLVVVGLTVLLLPRRMEHICISSYRLRYRHINRIEYFLLMGSSEIS